MLAAGSAAQPPNAAPREPPAGEGVICAWAIYSVIAEVGARCFPGQDADFQAEVARSVTKLDDYVARNTPGWTPEQTAQFKESQGGKGAPASRLCTGDAVMMYRAMAAGGPKAARQPIDALTAKPGKPSWGTCL